MGEQETGNGSVSMKAYVACAGYAAKARFFAAGGTCAGIAGKEIPANECRYGCIGGGDCVAACKPGAIKCEFGKVTIDRDKCDGCGDCVGACPRKVITMVPEDATNFIPCSSQVEDEDEQRGICGYGCIGCGECVDNCPRGAVSLVDHRAVIDYSKCVGCVTCTVVCKKKIIVDTLHDLTKVKGEVAFVRCSGGKNNQKLKDRGVKTCREAYELADKSGLCAFGCTGLGRCTEVCRFDAIHVEDGVSRVDPDKCVGCGDCTYACPFRLIELGPYKGAKIVACSSTASVAEKRLVCDSGCIACGDCADNCPNGAIAMKDGVAVSDPAKCDNCSICTYVCTRNVIREQKAGENVYLQRKALEETEGGAE